MPLYWPKFITFQNFFQKKLSSCTSKEMGLHYNIIIELRWRYKYNTALSTNFYIASGISSSHKCFLRSIKIYRMPLTWSLFPKFDASIEKISFISLDVTLLISADTYKLIGFRHFSLGLVRWNFYVYFIIKIR